MGHECPLLAAAPPRRLEVAVIKLFLASRPLYLAFIGMNSLPAALGSTVSVV